jgi:hypothetical protein
MGRSPYIIPPLIANNPNTFEDIRMTKVIAQLENDVTEVKDNLSLAKISQTLYANQFWANNYPLETGDHVLLSILKH